MQLVVEPDVNEEFQSDMSTIEGHDNDEKSVLKETDESKTCAANGKLKHLEVCVTGSVNIESEVDDLNDNVTVDKNDSLVHDEQEVTDTARNVDKLDSLAEEIVVVNGCKESTEEIAVPENAQISTCDEIKETADNGSAVSEIAEEKESSEIRTINCTETENTVSSTEEIHSIVTDNITSEVALNGLLVNETNNLIETNETEHVDQIDKCEETKCSESKIESDDVEKAISNENMAMEEITDITDVFESDKTEKVDGAKAEIVSLKDDILKQEAHVDISDSDVVLNSEKPIGNDVENGMECNEIENTNHITTNISTNHNENTISTNDDNSERNILKSSNSLNSSTENVNTNKCKDSDEEEAKKVFIESCDVSTEKTDIISEDSHVTIPKSSESVDQSGDKEVTAQIKESGVDEESTVGNDVTSVSKMEKIHTPKLDISFGEDTETMEIDDESPKQCETSEDKNSASEVKGDKESSSVDKATQLIKNGNENDTIVDIDKPETRNVTDVDKEVLKPNNICKLSNTLDILSDDEEFDKYVKDIDKVVPVQEAPNENKCINLDDDDDVMLIDDVDQKESTDSKGPGVKVDKPEELVKTDTLEETNEQKVTPETDTKDTCDDSKNEIEVPKLAEKGSELPTTDEKLSDKPLVPPNFLKTFKTNVAEMTRDDLEEFCLLKIVEGVIDRTSLSEIKTKLKSLTTQLEEWKKKSMMLIKQNRDLQIVLKTVQEEQKKRPDAPVAPLKITRSVGMQVYMAETDRCKKKQQSTRTSTITKATTPTKAVTTPAPVQQPIPVPKLVPAQTTPAKGKSPVLQNATVSSNTGKVASPTVPVAKSPPKQPEKRTHAVMSSQSVTVDLTDDEPPAKQMTPRAATNAVRLVSPQNLLAPRAQLQNGPRKVFIPINQNSNVRPGSALMLKPVPPPQNPRQRAPMSRMPQNAIRVARAANQRHPAPLPDCLKQPQPPNWKAIPPSPDLKISKVDNGIVISWKIVGYQEDSYEEIASYQLYAYQETSSPPNTLLWKKIGDVKALPLPMACTLTQFMAGYKYYFAVRAVDVRSRIGPFSLPGSILLLNK